MKKKFFQIAVIVILTLALTGCNVSVSTTTTSTQSHTDAYGNTTTTTTTKTTENGKSTETTETVVEEAEVEHIVASISFSNETGADICELYFASAQDSEWSGNAFGEEPLADGFTRTFEDALTYSEDNMLWDMMIVNAEEQEITFNNLNLAEAADAEDITVLIVYDASTEDYTAYVE